MGERLVCNQKVAGSTPVVSTFSELRPGREKFFTAAWKKLVPSTLVCQNDGLRSAWLIEIPASRSIGSEAILNPMAL